MKSTKLDHAVRIIRSRALKLQEDGKVLKSMGLEGHMSLLLDKIHRWFDYKEESEVCDLVVDALIAFTKTESINRTQVERPPELSKEERERRQGIGPVERMGVEDDIAEAVLGKGPKITIIEDEDTIREMNKDD